MKSTFSVLVIAVFLVAACNNNTVKDVKSGDSTPGAGKDPAIGSTTRPAVDTSKDDEDEDLIKMYKDYVDQYKKPCIIDSVFALGGDTFHLHVKHYCLLDSAIKAPGQYVKMYKLDSFVTHNFATVLKLDKNGKTILERTVYKKDFEKFLRPPLQKYGALLCPELSLSANQVKLDYSISIPLTDVGVGVTVLIDRNGTVSGKGE